MTVIIDYGVGNLGSVVKAFKAIGQQPRVTCLAKDLKKAGKVVLPGVGAFPDAMKALRKSGMIEPLKKHIDEGKPILGLCLGLQLLFEESEEGGKVKGLGIFKGRIVRFTRSTLKIPHMGWNQLLIKKKDCPLLKGVADCAWMYFVHSYYVVPKDRSIIATTTDYGIEFTSMIWKDNIYAMQFHPEKSQSLGLRILENFVDL